MPHYTLSTKSVVRICIVLITFTMVGCASVRYRMGYNAGYNDYEKAKKTRHVKNGYAVGWVNGFLLANSLDEMGKSIENLNESIKKLRDATK